MYKYTKLRPASHLQTAILSRNFIARRFQLRNIWYRFDWLVARFCATVYIDHKLYAGTSSIVELYVPLGSVTRRYPFQSCDLGSQGYSSPVSNAAGFVRERPGVKVLFVVLVSRRRSSLETKTKTRFSGKVIENTHILLYSKADCTLLDIV